MLTRFNHNAPSARKSLRCRAREQRKPKTRKPRRTIAGAFLCPLEEVGRKTIDHGSRFIRSGRRSAQAGCRCNPDRSCRDTATADGVVDVAARQSDVGQFEVGHMMQLIFRPIKISAFLHPMNNTLIERVAICSGVKQFARRRPDRRIAHDTLLKTMSLYRRIFACCMCEINGRGPACLRQQPCVNSMEQLRSRLSSHQSALPAMTTKNRPEAGHEKGRAAAARPFSCPSPVPVKPSEAFTSRPACGSGCDAPRCNGRFPTSTA